MNLINELVTWLQKKVKETKAKGIIFGLSGGMDSSVVGVLVKKALSRNHLALLMPCHSRVEDTKDAKLVARKFHLNTRTIDLTPIYDHLIAIVDRGLWTIDSKQKAVSRRQAKECSGQITVDRGLKIACANLKPRLRMMTLYYFANKLNYLVCGTGNKSELMIGYFTKYGDGGVDLLPLGDLFKTEVKKLAKRLDIPQKIIDKTPTAGLWAGQTDEGELGITYEELDEILDSLKKKKKSKRGKEKVEWVKKLIVSSEHKRSLPSIFVPRNLNKATEFHRNIQKNRNS